MVRPNVDLEVRAAGPAAARDRAVIHAGPRAARGIDASSVERGCEPHPLPPY